VKASANAAHTASGSSSRPRSNRSSVSERPMSRTTRKPTVSSWKFLARQFRNADRQARGLLLQQPPPITRLELLDVSGELPAPSFELATAYVYWHHSQTFPDIPMHLIQPKRSVSFRRRDVFLPVQPGSLSIPCWPHSCYAGRIRSSGLRLRCCPKRNVSSAQHGTHTPTRSLSVAMLSIMPCTSPWEWTQITERALS
jgi:hypothetical protein